VGTGVVYSDPDPFDFVEPLLLVGQGSVVIIVSNHRSMLVRAALLFRSFDGERLCPTRG
jgi:hypothetical protein